MWPHALQAWSHLHIMNPWLKVYIYCYFNLDPVIIGIIIQDACILLTVVWILYVWLDEAEEKTFNYDHMREAIIIYEIILINWNINIHSTNKWFALFVHLYMLSFLLIVQSLECYRVQTPWNTQVSQLLQSWFAADW